MSNYATVAVIGVGYVGLPLACALADRGHRVIGVDVNAEKVAMLNRGESFLADVPDAHLAGLIQKGKLAATADFGAVREADAIVICVPTPLSNKEPDLTYVNAAVDGIAPHLRRNQLIVLESSTYPGTTEEKVKPRLEAEGWRIGHDLFLAYSPERVDPGNKTYALPDIPKIVSGVTEQCLARVKELYGGIFRQIVPVSSPKVAEFAKLLENSQRLVNISFINEISVLAHRMGVDIWEIIEAAKTKPMGFTAYYPSAGAGGHCIPVDPYYLTWVGFRQGVPLMMIQQAGWVNDMMPHFIAEEIVRHVRRNVPEGELRIGVVGVTYKKDVPDLRESAALKVIRLLGEQGVRCLVYDPVYRGELPDGLARFQPEPEELARLDAVAIMVDHSAAPWERIVRHSRCVIDVRNATAGIEAPNIIRL